MLITLVAGRRAQFPVEETEKVSDCASGLSKHLPDGETCRKEALDQGGASCGTPVLLLVGFGIWRRKLASPENPIKNCGLPQPGPVACYSAKQNSSVTSPVH